MDVNGSGNDRVIELVFLECPECGNAIACRLGDGPPEGCHKHTE